MTRRVSERASESLDREFRARLRRPRRAGRTSRMQPTAGPSKQTTLHSKRFAFLRAVHLFGTNWGHWAGALLTYFIFWHQDRRNSLRKFLLYLLPSCYQSSLDLG